MRIYTRTGDRGDTGLSGGARARKSDLRIEALGAVDETNAALGVARTHTREDAVLDPVLEALQHRLFDLGADLAAPPITGRESAPRIVLAHVDALETTIDRLELDLQPLRAFILPGGAPAAAALHLARTVARRAERAVIRMADGGDAVDYAALMFVNRLSDLLFVAARHANREHGDVPWRQDI
jgi:cob(I)alamin adenosyltransferase